MELTPAAKALRQFLEANPNKEFHNNDLAEGTGYSNTTMSTAACNMWRAGMLKRVGKGRWIYEQAIVKSPDSGNSTVLDGSANPATVVAMEHIIEAREWFEIKPTKAIESPGGYWYHTIIDRNGRKGIVIWDS